MPAPTLMVQGTASSVGKSVLTAGLCRLFQQAGLRVAPFKAQNMANNAAVTADGGEIGRAQACQAQAARVEPTVDMNPVLLKPEGDRRSQIVVLGKAVGSMGAREYHAFKPELRSVIAGCLQRLRSVYDLVVIEGAGSPAEINLKSGDIVNMHVAEVADAPVLLVGDIDRGGVFASFVGTLELLEPDERARVAAFVINKFRGDTELLRPGLDFLSTRTGKPILGVIPHLAQLRIADEDSLALDDRRAVKPAAIDVAVIRLPRISNYDEFAPLEHEPGVSVRFVEDPETLAAADLVILPGTKSTISDLSWLRQAGFERLLRERAIRREPILGICGGCQMLGRSIDDPDGVESDVRSACGLDLLPIATRFANAKVTRQVRTSAKRESFLMPADVEVAGYEIHMGIIEPDEGAINQAGAVVGTMIHGLFENPNVRAHLLTSLRVRKGLLDGPSAIPGVDEYDRVAATLRRHLDLNLLFQIAREEAWDDK